MRVKQLWAVIPLPSKLKLAASIPIFNIQLIWVTADADKN